MQGVGWNFCSMIHASCSMIQMVKVITIGSVSQDIFFPTDEGVVIETPEDVLSQKKLAFEFGAKYHVNERFESLGGCSVNVAVGLVKLGEDVSAYTTIGDDVTGKWIHAELEKTGVKMEFVGIASSCKSDLSAIIVDQKNEDRVIFSNQVANQKLVFDVQKIGNPQWIFIGDLSGDWKKNLDLIVAIAKEKNILLAFNPRQKTIHEDAEKIREVSSICDLLFVNKDEALEILSSTNIDHANEDEIFLMTQLRKIGAKIVVLTDGKRGAWVGNEAGNFYVKAMLVETVDTTGAGDAFASGFFAAYLKEKPIQECLKWGIANSSSSIKQYGGQVGLLNQEQVNFMVKDIVVQSID